MPLLPVLGYQIGSAWLTPILFFVVLPALGRALGDDKVQPLKANRTPLLWQAYFRWLPRSYLPLWLLSLVWTAFVVSQDDVGPATVAGLAFSAAIVSATASALCHELMHRKSRLDQWIARIMASLMGYPHFIQEHLHHHQHVGVVGRGLSATVGESLWAFLLRVLPEGRKAAREFDRRKTRGGVSAITINSLMTLTWAVAFTGLAGWTGLLLFVFQAAFAIFAVQGINYIQHYGLVRLPGESIGHDLSWEDNCPVANCLTLNINRHSAHHRKPGRPFFELAHDGEAPRLPASYMIMLCIALVPRLWRKIMDARLVAYLKSKQGTGAPAPGQCLGVLGEILR